MLEACLLVSNLYALSDYLSTDDRRYWSSTSYPTPHVNALKIERQSDHLGQTQSKLVFHASLWSQQFTTMLACPSASWLASVGSMRTLSIYTLSPKSHYAPWISTATLIWNLWWCLSTSISKFATVWVYQVAFDVLPSPADMGGKTGYLFFHIVPPVPVLQTLKYFHTSWVDRITDMMSLCHDLILKSIYIR